jgi:hypothetical protein
MKLIAAVVWTRRCSPRTASRSSDTMSAYDTFADAANTGALKVVLEGGRSPGRRCSAVVGAGRVGAGLPGVGLDARS